MLIHWLAAGALIVVARFVFLLCTRALRTCRWCSKKSRFCLRCGGKREHFRIGARLVHRVRLAVGSAVREWRYER